MSCCAWFLEEEGHLMMMIRDLKKYKILSHCDLACQYWSCDHEGFVMWSLMIINKEVNIKVCDPDIHCGGVEGVGPWQFDCDKFKKLSYCLVCSNIDFDKRIKLRRLIMIIMVVQDLRRGRVQLGGNLLRRSWQATPSTSLHLHHDHHLRHHHQLHRCHDQHPNKGWHIFHSGNIFSVSCGKVLNCLLFPSLVASYAPSLETLEYFKKTRPVQCDHRKVIWYLMAKR